MKEALEKNLPNNLINKAINIRGCELAWNYENVMKVIDILSEKKFTIHGGDILNKNLSYTYDNWFYNGNEYEEGIKIAKEYIENYHQRMGNDYYYVLVFKVL